MSGDDYKGVLGDRRRLTCDCGVLARAFDGRLEDVQAPLGVGRRGFVVLLLRLALVGVAVLAVVLASSSFGVSSASARPLFVSQSATYPAHGTIHGGLSRFVTTSGHEVDCSLALGLASLGLRLSLFLILLHKCSSTFLFNGAECNSAGEPKGLIHLHVRAWLGYLTNAVGEKMVGWLVRPLSGNTVTEFTCEANALEKIKLTLLGEAVGAVPAAEVNAVKKSFKIVFAQSSAGLQTPQAFLLPLPLLLMTGVHLTSDITGTVSEKVETSFVSEVTVTSDGGEEGEIGEGTPVVPGVPSVSEQKCTPSSPNVVYGCGRSVNGGTGDEVEAQSDLSIGGRGPGLRLTRTYDAFNAAKASEPGFWGFGWTGPYGRSLKVSGETVSIHEEDGSVIEFFKFGSGYTQGGWNQARLEKSGSNYIYTLPDQSKFEFNSEGQLVKETERNGNSNTFTYNGSKQLEKVKDGDERLLTFKYNASGLVESVTDPMSHVVKYAYSEGNLSSVTIEGKERWKFEYESHLLTKITDGRGNVTTLKYEAVTHKATEETIGGHKRKWEYKAGETKITEPNGSETVETFNSAGEPTKITQAKGASVETVTEYEYEDFTYAQTKLIDPNKHATEYKYDEQGNKASEKDPGGDERKWKYDKAHNVLEETTPEGETTTIKRNEHGEPTVIESPIGTETQKMEFKYGTHGELSEEIDPLGHVTKYTYDAAGDRETETDAAGDERKWKFNEDSLVTEEISPRGFTTKIEHDEQGRPTRITDPLGHLTEYIYDGDGNVTSETDGNKHATKDEYNEENLPTRVEEPNKTLVETGYDAEGQMTSRTDGNKHTWEYKRNLLEQVTEEKNPLGKTTLLKYEKAGNLETREDPEKHTTTYKYDTLNRLTLINYSTGKPSEVTFEYNKDNKVTKMKDETGTTEYTWDKLDRLTLYKNGAGKLVKYEYNLADLPTKITYPNGEHITREYDKADRLEKVTDFKGNVTSFDYNKDSQLEKTLFPSATEETDENVYNEADQLKLIKMLAKASVLASLEYERDNDGQVKKTTSKGLPGAETSESLYDENNRLSEANKQAYEYDKANNPLKIAGLAGYAYNEADELTESHETKYAYNEDGQRTKLEPKTGEPTTYTYDQAGNLTAVKQGTTIEDSYTYDGNGLRQTQTIKGVKANLVWNATESVPALLSDETNSYIYGPEGTPIEQISETGETSYLHHDQQGSTRLITNTKGENIGAYTYTPYGAVEEHTGTATTPLGYDGQYTNISTGLIYLRKRTYDPKTAQFLTVDQALEETGEPYAYAEDNPLNTADPSGEGGGPCFAVQVGAQAGVSTSAEVRVCLVVDREGSRLQLTVAGHLDLYTFHRLAWAVDDVYRNGVDDIRHALRIWNAVNLAGLGLTATAQSGIYTGPIEGIEGWRVENAMGLQVGPVNGQRIGLANGGRIWMIGTGWRWGWPSLFQTTTRSAYTWSSRLTPRPNPNVD